MSVTYMQRVAATTATAAVAILAPTSGVLTLPQLFRHEQHRPMGSDEYPNEIPLAFPKEVTVPMLARFSSASAGSSATDALDYDEDVRAAVSRLWAEDWDSDEDAVYDSW
ncbi:hypothetical protein [Cellulomonas oligotrophica]|uniref:Uncharacterized protein n=1 Tax=Cellulomonas oligotrophica TaxID=931536 RepID=A0A7Y9FIT0_9CELL|nr:hypothetical protein [Cellulomonas oligotrophica]NYD87762.1 hypothetical protein [Cellulomonas oligotrophica]GIG33033.1 hypothetical protein Col01nite_21920 [Cellulomonas oligotrophica]